LHMLSAVVFLTLVIAMLCSLLCLHAVLARCVPCCAQAGTILSAASPTLAPALMDAAHALLGLAHSCLFRAGVIAAVACPVAAAQLQDFSATAAAGPLADAQQQLGAVGEQLLSPAGVQWGSAPRGLELKAALAAEAALQALQRAASVEGLAAVVSLRLQEVRPIHCCKAVLCCLGCSVVWCCFLCVLDIPSCRATSSCESPDAKSIAAACS
jgi:hypothetical protein